jgi:hypothetical protein
MSQTAAPVPRSSWSLNRLCTRWQWALIAGRTGFLIGLLLLILLTRPGSAHLLLGTWPGQKMLAQAFAFILVGTVIELVLFGLLNRWQSVGQGIRFGLIAVGEAALLWFFFLPAFFVLSVGPAALNIMENLSPSPS